MVSEWAADAAAPRGWIAFAGSYLFRTDGVRWLVDPPPLPRIGSEGLVEAARRDLARTDFVILTHAHSDHFCVPVLRELRGLPMKWIVPDHMAELVADRVGLGKRRMVAISHGESTEVRGLKISAFEGMHWEVRPGSTDGERTGVDATGYLIECGGQRLLFPGDTRTYDAGVLPRVGDIDWVFAHVWLGRGCARRSGFPLLEAFCEFMLKPRPKGIVLGHLWEVARGPADYWNRRHAAVVTRELRRISPQTDIVTPNLGERICL